MHPPTAFAEFLERHIVQRTWGRVHRLAVELTDGRVLVRGQTRSYYTKQLTIQACREALALVPGATLEVDIEVGEAAPLLAR